MAPSILAPRVHLMALCDEIEERDEAETYNLLGVRVHLAVDTFPYLCMHLSAFLQVSGQEGVPAAVAIQIVQTGGDDDAIVFSSPPKELTLRGPLSLLALAFDLEDCSFPEAGLYYVQAFAGDKLIYERPLILFERTVSRNGESR